MACVANLYAWRDSRACSRSMSSGVAAAKEMVCDAGLREPSGPPDRSAAELCLALAALVRPRSGTASFWLGGAAAPGQRPFRVL